ncbi:MAG TPA: zinc-binding alcohol dehydrogenase family protein [Candidatus Thioglobus sp.]|jgi:zinc-binding alcohol dehydrogenase family protein|nr:zinc-binding alcohol dehydrogenase family protein [Candidatus Thioglobus sp.]HIL43024.1 zinc-binding alcohol dehydrogenase family protein [Gammaproteobacteria bacterium]
MNAIGYNGSEFVQFDKSLDSPSSRDLLVEIKSISMNPIDLKVKKTIVNDINNPVVLGFDACGVVIEVGNDVTLFNVGDEVFYSGDLSRDGSNATHQLVDERIVGIKPTSMTYSEAAALPLTSVTAWESLFHRLNITTQDKDKTVLLIGAAGGVGSVAIQLAKKIVGIKVIATASRPQSKEWCIKMGADKVIQHDNLVDQFKDHELESPDYILCMGNPDDYFEEMANVIAPQGSICLLANASRKLDINILKPKSVTLVWEMMFTRAMFQTADMIKQHEILNEVSSMVDEGKVIGTATRTLSPISIENIKEAHSLIEKGDMIGKLVIEN